MIERGAAAWITIAASGLLLYGASAGAQNLLPGDWPAYGRDAGGSRHSPLTEITPQNAADLAVAWTFNTGEARTRPRRGEPSLQATPLIVEGLMYVSTPLGKVFALDPATGAVRWRYDARVDPEGGYGDFANRGVATWLDDSAEVGSGCRRRIYLGTLDARLIALDGATGAPCTGFGRRGVVDLRRGLRTAPFEAQAYQVTSPPTVVGDLVITGSAIADNSRANPASGEIRAYDARTGDLRWSWDPIPQDPTDPAYAAWGGAAPETGAANAWSVFAADIERDLVFVPTTSAAPDYFGGLRPGPNLYASSVVALRATTGERVWHFQTVHHDLWDYDNASPPALAYVRREGVDVPVVLQATKTGMLFVLHRDTGEPVFAVEERPVPASTVPGETAWPTQPFTAVTPPLSSHSFSLVDVWGASPEDVAACRATVEGLRSEGIFTPPSLEGTIAMPSNIGGAHWGGVAVDPTRFTAVVPVNRIASMVQLIPADVFDARQAQRISAETGDQFTRMRGTPYVMRRRFLLAPSGAPCSPPPFGELVAVSLEHGGILWRVPLGSMQGDDAPPSGAPNLGGPITTATGLVFIAATIDRKFRAYDITTGEQLWQVELPAGGRATPVTYEADSRQFVAIAAGGSGLFGIGDAIVAFALPAGGR